jgi:hypothetical protein
MTNVQKINKNYQAKSRITSKNNEFTFFAYPAFLPGESHGWRGLMGCGLWGCKESDTTKQLTHTHKQRSDEVMDKNNFFKCVFRKMVLAFLER